MDELSTGHFHMPYDIVREGTSHCSVQHNAVIKL